jgi:hypothetical protein
MESGISITIKDFSGEESGEVEGPDCYRTRFGRSKHLGERIVGENNGEQFERRQSVHCKDDKSRQGKQAPDTSGITPTKLTAVEEPGGDPETGSERDKRGQA